MLTSIYRHHINLLSNQYNIPKLHPRLVHCAVHLEPLHIGNSPAAARSCERMSLHLPGLRHPLQALHLRSRWHLTRRKLGRRQDLGYLEGGFSTSIPLPSAYVQGSYMYF
jgi:hypothetical protein